MENPGLGGGPIDLPKYIKPNCGMITCSKGLDFL